MKTDIANGVEDTEVLMVSYVEDNTSLDKDWILNSSSAVHVCSHKDIFNSLAPKEEGIIKIADGSVCEVIGTGIVNIASRDDMVHAIEAV